VIPDILSPTHGFSPLFLLHLVRTAGGLIMVAINGMDMADARICTQIGTLNPLEGPTIQSHIFSLSISIFYFDMFDLACQLRSYSSC
jgi:hypothetical protein